MNRNSFKVICLLLMGVLAVASAQAGSLDNTDIPNDSNWYVHVNLELIRNSSAGRQFALETYNEAMDDIEEELGLAIRDEFEGVTVFGSALPEQQNVLSDGAVILHGIFSDETRQALLSKWAESDATYREEYEAGMTYYIVENDESKLSYTDEGGESQDVTLGRNEELYFAFGGTQTLVTQSPEMMQVFLSGGGHLGGFEQVNNNALVVLQADRALLQGGANTSTEITGDWDSSVLKNVDAVALVIAEQRDGLMFKAQLVANSAEVAMSVRNIVEGMVALKALSETEGVVGEVLRSVRFDNDNSVLNVSLEITADQIAAIKDL